MYSDLADAHLKAVQWLMRQKPGRGRHDVFNLGSGAGYSVKQVVQEIGRTVGRPCAACARRAPAEVIRPSWWAASPRRNATWDGRRCAASRRRSRTRSAGAARWSAREHPGAPAAFFLRSTAGFGSSRTPGGTSWRTTLAAPATGFFTLFSARSASSWPAAAITSTSNNQEPAHGSASRRRLLRLQPLLQRPAPAPAPAPQQAARRQAPRQASSPRRAAIADARRMAARGDFTGAETALQGADRLVPGLAETAAARREIADLRTTRGDGRRDRADRRRDATRIATLVEAARAAIARRDYDAADRALDEAERIDARDPAVVRARNELSEAAARPGRRDGRN